MKCRATVMYYIIKYSNIRWNKLNSGIPSDKRILGFEIGSHLEGDLARNSPKPLKLINKSPFIDKLQEIRLSLMYRADGRSGAKELGGGQQAWLGTVEKHVVGKSDIVFYRPGAAPTTSGPVTATTATTSTSSSSGCRSSWCGWSTHWGLTRTNQLLKKFGQGLEDKSWPLWQRKQEAV